MEDKPQVSNEVLEGVLTRTIGFIANCDSKVTSLLSVVGVIVTILFTIKPPNLDFMKLIIQSNGLNPVLGPSVFGFLLSLYFFLEGIYYSSQVLIARNGVNNDNNKSIIFFGSISQHTSSQNYFSEINKTSYNYREDLVCQIYLNSKICTEKFESYNKGFKRILFSLPVFIICWSYLF